MRRVVFALVLAGCGDNAVVDDFSDSLGQADCAFLVRCGAIDAADCPARIARGRIEQPGLHAALVAGKVTYDRDAARRCLAQYEELSCAWSEQLGSLDACSDVYVGHVPVGARCGFDRECESDYCGEATCDEACCIGTCRPATPSPVAGDPCRADCGPALYCGADDICHPLGVAGDPCNDVMPCALARECAGRTSTEPGTCTPLGREGDTCVNLCDDVALECAAGICTRGALGDEPCDTSHPCSRYYTCTDGICVRPAVPDPQPNGAACMVGYECESRYCGPMVCEDPPACY